MINSNQEIQNDPAIAQNESNNTNNNNLTENTNTNNINDNTNTNNSNDNSNNINDDANTNNIKDNKIIDDTNNNNSIKNTNTNNPTENTNINNINDNTNNPTENTNINNIKDNKIIDDTNNNNSTENTNTNNSNDNTNNPTENTNTNNTNDNKIIVNINNNNSTENTNNNNINDNTNANNSNDNTNNINDDANTNNIKDNKIIDDTNNNNSTENTNNNNSTENTNTNNINVNTNNTIDKINDNNINDNTNNNNTTDKTNENTINCDNNINSNDEKNKSLEQLRNKNGTIFSYDKFNKSIHINDNDKQFLQMGLKFYINELRLKKKIKRRDKDINDVYIIEKSWYRRWKNFVNYSDIKKVASNSEEYLKNPFLYQVNQNSNPGHITNSNLVIEEKPENLFSENDIPLKIKTKKEAYKIIPEVNFKKLYEVFGCDKIIKKTIRINKKKDFNREIDLITKEFNVIFLPTENVKCNELKEYKLYLTTLLNIEETIKTISEILNKNIEIKQNLGIENYDSLEKHMKIYLSKDEKTIPEFKQTFVDFFEEFKENKNYQINKFLIKTSKKSQLNEINSKYFIIEFILNKDSYFIFAPENNIQSINNQNNNDPANINNTTNNNENNNSPANNNNQQINNENNNNNNETNLNNQFTDNDIEENQIDIKDAKPEFMSIFGEAKYGLEINKLDKKKNLKGLVGIGNIGNTCYMNTSLQCLSNCKILTDYFLYGYYIPFINRTNSIGSKGKIVESYAEVIKHLWYGQKKFIEPYRLKNECGMVRNMFAGYNQQDAQEFITFILDELHEDLNKVLSKPYIQIDDTLKFNSDIDEYLYNKNNFLARNQSIIVDFFYGMFKSTVVCPNPECKNISKSYDPYSIISISMNIMPINVELDVFFIFEKFEYKIIKFKMTLQRDIGVYTFKKKIEYIFNIDYNTFEIYKKKGEEMIAIREEYMGLFDFLEYNKEIYLYQIPSIVFGKNEEKTKKIYQELLKTPDLLEKREKELNNNKVKSNIQNKETNIIDRNKWIKFFCYIYSYNKNEEPFQEISYPKILYINVDWKNEDIYNYIIEKFKNLITENKNQENYKKEYFPKLNEMTNKLLKDKKKLNLKTHKEIKYPFILFYEKFAAIQENVMIKYDNFKDLIFPATESCLIKKIIEKAISEKKNISEYQFIFKLVCLPELKEKIIKLNEPKIMNKKEKTNNPKKDTSKIELTYLLSQFGLMEDLTEGNEWYCPKCQIFQLAKKQIEIFTCPEILILHLKRFREGKKLDNIINFPIEGLDMNKYIKYDETGKNDNIYDLFAVANHQGNFTGGHYNAYAKNFITNKWYEFDDEYIKEINKNEIVSESSYVLFYAKRNSKYENIEKIYKKPLENIVFKK